MPRKLKIDALKSDLAAVEKLMEGATKIGDPIGLIQFAERKQAIESALRELGGIPDVKASAALFFAGKPVIGSAGIIAEFAGSILKDFQDIVSTVFGGGASGEVGSRGRIARSNESQLLVTAIAKGSFGFVLDELTPHTEAFDSGLRNVLTQTADLIDTTSGQDEDRFLHLLATMNSRVLHSLRDFFVNLDKHEATVRLVENDRDIRLDAAAVHRARLRTEFKDIDDKVVEFEGVLSGFLPVHKKFELTLADNSILYGSVSDQAIAHYTRMTEAAMHLLGTECRLEINQRTVQTLVGPSKQLNTLLRFVLS